MAIVAQARRERAVRSVRLCTLIDSFLKSEKQVTNCEGVLALVGRCLRACMTAVDAIVVSHCQFCTSSANIRNVKMNTLNMLKLSQLKLSARHLTHLVCPFCALWPFCSL